MNIFVTHPDPTVSAQNLDDLRVNKMILESASLMANAMAYHGAPIAALPVNAAGQPYRTVGWQQHPCCLWVKQSKSNYLWLSEHLSELIAEKHRRTGRAHSMVQNHPRLILGMNFIPPGPCTDFVNCTPYKMIPDVIQAYRMTMIDKWKADIRAPKWTGTECPSWARQP
jgi:hypothetical protein